MAEEWETLTRRQARGLVPSCWDQWPKFETVALNGLSWTLGTVPFNKIQGTDGVSAGHWTFILRCSGIIPLSDLAENYSVHKSEPTAFPKLIRVEHTRPPFWETRLCSEYTHSAIILVMSLGVLQSINCHPRTWLFHRATREGSKYWCTYRKADINSAVK